jgi:hypothetical protein
VVRRADSKPGRRFSLWMIGLWIVLLLAALGCVQYLQHADYPYLLAGLLVIVVCTGCILRQAWARSPMRGLLLLLALWSLVTGVLMLLHAGDFDRARAQALLQPQLAEVALWMIARAERTWQVGMLLKALAVPFLLWLAWQLGKPAVVTQFRTRKR